MTYCYGQALQLANGQALQLATKIIRGSLDAAYELTKVIKYSSFKNHKKKSNTLQKGNELPAV